MSTVTLCQDLETRVTGSIKQSKAPVLIGVAGGSGSGKTFFARDLCAQLGSRCVLVRQDSFYIDQSSRFDFDGGSVNFDHPDSVDFTLLSHCLKALKSGHPAQLPVYDFATHSRQALAVPVEPRPVVIVDGILILHSREVRSLFDESIFFDTPEEVRFQRRVSRDVKERGRTAEGVGVQFRAQVKPMHDLFVKPSKVFASRIFQESGDYGALVLEYCKKLKD